MIEDFAQAKAIQERRARNGKKGYAKAVRRYCLREALRRAPTPIIQAEVREHYTALLKKLPYYWPAPTTTEQASV